MHIGLKPTFLCFSGYGGDCGDAVPPDPGRAGEDDRQPARLGRRGTAQSARAPQHVKLDKNVSIVSRSNMYQQDKKNQREGARGRKQGKVRTVCVTVCVCVTRCAFPINPRNCPRIAILW